MLLGRQTERDQGMPSPNTRWCRQRKCWTAMNSPVHEMPLCEESQRSRKWHLRTPPGVVLLKCARFARMNFLSHKRGERND